MGKMKEKLKNNLILFICSILFIGFILFNIALANNVHYCKSGEHLQQLKENNKVYIECGIEGKTKYVRMIEDGGIVEKNVVVIPKQTHIEEFDINWTDSDWIGAIWVVWVFVSLLSLGVIIFYIKELLLKIINKR